MKRSATKTTVSLFALATVLTLAYLAAPHATAAPILAVDFENEDSTTETDFQSFAHGLDTSSGSVSQSVGAFTVTFSDLNTGEATAGFSERGSLSDSGAFTYADLYNDFGFDKSGPFTVTIEDGTLAANTAYDVRLFAYDYHSAVYNSGTEVTMNYTPTSGTTGSAVAVTFTADHTPADNLDYSNVGTFTTNGSAQIIFEVTAGTNDKSNNPRTLLNGLTVAVPEPTSFLLLGLAGIVALRPRRRRAGAGSDLYLPSS